MDLLLFNKNVFIFATPRIQVYLFINLSSNHYLIWGNTLVKWWYFCSILCNSGDPSHSSRFANLYSGSFIEAIKDGPNNMDIS